MKSPPEGLPLYRLLTGPDDAAFCRRVSEALALGYRLHGSPSVTFNGTSVIAAQALVWPSGAGAQDQDQLGPSQEELDSTVARMEVSLRAVEDDGTQKLMGHYAELADRFSRDLSANPRDVSLAKASALMVVQAAAKGAA